MAIFRLKSLDIYLILMSLDSITFGTPIGTLPVSLIGSFLFFIRIIPLSPKITFKSIYNLSLLLFCVFFTLTSLFIGDSVLGNLSRIWISVFISLLLPNLNISKQTWSNSIKKIIIFHFFFLVFDFFFETPWGWGGEDGSFFIGFQSPDYYRPSGLFGEPSFYCLAVNSLLLILVILRNCSQYDCLVVLVSNLMSTSVSGFLCSLVIIFTNYILEMGPQLRRFLNKGLLNKKIIISFLIFIILTIPFLVVNNRIFERLNNPLLDTSMIGRTVGLLPVIESVYETSPLIGLGLGSEGIANLVEAQEIDYLYGTKVHATVVNGLVSIFAFGGFVGLTLYSIYILRGLQLKFIIAYFFLLASSGKVFFIFSFLIPAFNKYLIKNKKMLKK